VARDVVTVRRPEKNTRPKLFYKGAHQSTLDPVAARRPEGGIFMWSEQGSFHGQVTSGAPGGFANSAAAALLSYDVPHRAPWDGRVSLYTWTKGIAAGAYLVPLLMIVTGGLTAASLLWTLVAPILGGVFLAATGGLLLWDLAQPKRFYMIFTRPQWKSWLVRGAFIIAGYSLVLALHFLASLIDAPSLRSALAVAGVPLAALTAVYTAYLFAQSKARDLWQSALLPPQLLVQALMAGGATLFLAATLLEPGATTALARLVAVASLVHLLLVLGEISLAHPTAHARLAVREMTRGRFRAFFLVGIVLMAVGSSTPWLGLVGALSALAGLLAYEHAYVQAGQAVPLA
jgi:formate-dependent nitrite reductase membrane component NrfD